MSYDSFECAYDVTSDTRDPYLVLLDIILGVQLSRLVPNVCIELDYCNWLKHLLACSVFKCSFKVFQFNRKSWFLF